MSLLLVSVYMLHAWIFEVSALVLAVLASPARSVRFANTFQSSMVFQRDAPVYCWGYMGLDDDTHTNGSLMLVLNDSSSGQQRAAVAAILHSSNNTWTATIPPQAATTKPATLSIVAGDTAVAGETADAVHDIVFGEVILVTGQSNTVISVNQTNVNNATAEAENEAEAERVGRRRGLVRLLVVPEDSTCVGTGSLSCGSSDPQLEYGGAASADLPCINASVIRAPTGCSNLPWARANASNVAGFSALGWYLGRQLLAMRNEAVPIGVVVASTSGTPIQYWSSPQSIAKCYHGSPPLNKSNPSMMGSVLYNSIMFPLIQAQITFSGERVLSFDTSPVLSQTQSDINVVVW